MVPRINLVALVSLPFLFVPCSYAQQMTLEQRLKAGTEAVKIGCGVANQEKHVDFSVGADGSVTLKQPPGANVKGEFKYSSAELNGLLAAFQTEITAEGAALSAKQLDCMKLYVDRVINILLPDPASASK